MGRGDVDVTLRFKAETAQAIAATNALRSAVANLSTGVGSEISRIQTRSKTAFTGIGSDISGFSARVPVASRAVKTLGSEMDFLDRVGRRAGISVSGIGGSLVGFAGPAAIATTLIGSLAGGIFTLAKQAAEVGDAIFDLTQKVNVAAETVSTLKNEGELAGVEFQTIGNALGIFNKNLEIAHDKNTALGKVFRTLKIDLRDNETALRSTFRALMAVEDGGQQGALAMQIFGKSGKEILGVIHSLNGDIDAATEKFRKMGSLITTESARAANEFSDKLKTLEQKFDGVTRAIGERFMPTASDALDKVGQALDNNSKHALTWADTLVSVTQFAATQIKFILEGLAIVIDGFNKTLSAFKDIGSHFAAGGNVDIEEIENEARARRGLPPKKPFGAPAPIKPTVGFGGDPDAEFAIPSGRIDEKKKKGRIDISDGGRRGGKKAADTQLQDALKEAALIERDAKQRLENDVTENKRALDQQARDIEEFTKRAKELADQQLNATIDRINAEQSAFETALRKKKISQDEFSRKDRELTLQTQEAVQKNSDEIFRLESERDQKISAAQVAAKERQLQIEEEAGARIIERIKRRIDQGVLLETEGERQIADIIDENFKHRIETLKEEEAHVSTSAERRAAITDEIIRLDGERAGAAEEAANRIADAIEREIQAERRFADELKEVQGIVKEIELRVADETIQIMEANFASRREIRQKRRDLALAEEAERHRLATESINRQKREVDQEIELLQKRIDSLTIGTTEEIEQHDRLIRSLDALRQKRQQLDQEQSKENVFSQTRKRRISDESQNADPFSGISDAFDSLGEKAADAFGATQAAGQQFSSILGQAFDSVAHGIGSLVENYVLLGSVGPGAVRKLLAASLAALAAEATAKAIFWTAQGIADLFFNPARAASDFAAAALFASLAGVSAVVGRQVAGDLFKSPESTTGNRTSNAGSRTQSGTSQPQPVNLDRNTTQAIVFRPNIQITMHGEAGAAFNYKVVDAVVQDMRLNGESRQQVRAELAK
jgi:hypothetical protein